MSNGSFQRFDADMKKAAGIANIEVSKFVKKVSFDLFTKIVRKTPVDTGRARSGWNIAVNAIDTSVPPKSTDLTKGEATTAALSKLSGAIILTPYSIVWISNNLPYIEVLEEGSSKQAPQGMVAVSIEEVKTGIANILNG